jgi:hypothetical protein
MKRLSKAVVLRLACLIAIALLATSAFGQDDGDGGGPANNDDFFDNEPFAAGPALPERDVLVDVRAWLKKANAPPMDGKQEKALRKIYDREVKNMEKTFDKRFGISLASALAAQSPTRGRRGAGASTAKPEHASAICKMSAQLVDKVLAGLRIDQQGVLRKYQSEQLRMTKTNLLTRNLEAAGKPLSETQLKQTDDLFMRESRLRTLMIIEAKGEPYQARTTPLEAQTTQRVAKLLDQEQVRIFLQTVASTKARQAGSCSGT